MKVEDVRDQFKRYALIERGMRPRSYKAIVSAVQKLCVFAHTEDLRQLNTNIIREFLCQTSQNRSWSPKTFRLQWQYLKTYFNWTIKRGYIAKNPVVSIDRPRLSKRLPRCLSTEDTLKVLTHTHWHKWRYEIERPRNEAIMAVFTFTGIRLSELLNLKTEHVSTGVAEIFIAGGKGDKDRIVPIHARLAPILRAYDEMRLRHCPPSQWYFTGVKSDKKLTAKRVRDIFQKVSQSSGVKVTPHMLRHTFGKLCVDQNVNLRTIQQMMGHADVSTTQMYTFVSTTAMKQNFTNVHLL